MLPWASPWELITHSPCLRCFLLPDVRFQPVNKWELEDGSSEDLEVKEQCTKVVGIGRYGTSGPDLPAVDIMSSRDAVLSARKKHAALAAMVSASGAHLRGLKVGDDALGETRLWLASDSGGGAAI
ncbi:hypothetical protein HAX54_043778 [Datura stramonium]|uniref:Uncharacterized protein n=1 Tax=Datura stramonium TaxID=4076 RepID=A0ABS8W542_DATST|nr:hypothetical protein [Datura stramonium]